MAARRPGTTDDPSLPAQQTSLLQGSQGTAHRALAAAGIDGQGGVRRVALSVHAKPAHQRPPDLHMKRG